MANTEILETSHARAPLLPRGTHRKHRNSRDVPRGSAILHRGRRLAPQRCESNAHRYTAKGGARDAEASTRGAPATAGAADRTRIGMQQKGGARGTTRHTRGAPGAAGAPIRTRIGMRQNAARGAPHGTPAARPRPDVHRSRTCQNFAPRSNGSAGSPKSGHRARTAALLEFRVFRGSRR